MASLSFSLYLSSTSLSFSPLVYLRGGPLHCTFYPSRYCLISPPSLSPSCLCSHLLHSHGPSCTQRRLLEDLAKFLRSFCVSSLPCTSTFFFFFTLITRDPPALPPRLIYNSLRVGNSFEASWCCRKLLNFVTARLYTQLLLFRTKFSP